MSSARLLGLGVLALSVIACGDDANSKPQSVTGDDGGTPKADAGSTVLHIDRSGLKDVGTSGALDYADPNLWMCRPDIDKNSCHDDLTATLINADGTTKAVPFEPAKNPEYDCFYVYPTVLLNGGATMTDFSDPKIVLDPLYPQGAYFSKLCQVYAPLYRQNGLNTSSSGATVTAGGNTMLGVQDVTDAFHYYLEHFNKGRKFVIIGHSQGTLTLIAVMKTEVDTKPEVRSQMISALLIGGGFTTGKGKTTGGSFQNIPVCTAPAQTGCVIAYHSFAKENPPGAGGILRAPPDGQEIACTEPGALAGNTGRYKSTMFAREPINSTFKGDGEPPAGVTTPFLLYRDMFRGKCVNTDGRGYLEITEELQPNDKRMPPYRFVAGAEAIGFGLHIIDFSLPIDDLIDAVSMQAAAALKK
jgi:pimeloyl-ACP methyl ester carboxylesterase